MARTDGDITLSVDVTAGDVKSAALDIQKEIERVFDRARLIKSDSLSEPFKRAQSSAANMYDKIGELLDRMRLMEATGLAWVGGNQSAGITAQYAELIQQLNSATNQASLLKAKLSEMSGVEVPTGPIQHFIQTMRTLGGVIVHPVNALGEFQAKLAQMAINLTNPQWAIQHLDMALIKFGNTLKTIGASAVKTFISGIKTATSAVGGFIKSLATANKHSGRNNGLLEVGFKKFIRYGLGVRSVFALLNKMRRALGEGLGNLAQYSPEFNSVISQFISSLYTLKNAFATAFAPIMSVVVPMLTTLMNALINVITLIGKFFAALTGKGTFIQAKHVNKDYAASLDKTGKSAGGASSGIDKAKESAEELKKTIAGFDDVEILHEDDADSSGSSGGSGGGGGAGGIGDILPSDMFETVAIESPIADFANRIRELIANQDWDGLGKFIGEKVNLVFSKIKELISWDNIGEPITKVVTAITTTLNSLVSTIDWKLIGSTFGEGINTIINTASLLINGIHWENLGFQLTRGLNSLITTINWTGLGELFADGVNSIFNFFYGVVTTFDWKTAAKSLASGLNGFLHKVDWKKIGATLSELFEGVLNFLGTAIAEFDWTGLGIAIKEFIEGVDWIGILSTIASNISQVLGALIGTIVETLQQTSGSDIVKGLCAGIKAAFNGIGQWIKDNIFTPFMDGFKNVFKINSPSKVMEEQGNFLIEGLLNGITTTWNNITQFFDEAANSILQLFNPESWVQTGSELVGKLKSGCSSAWDGLKKLFSKETGNTKNTVTKENWNEAGSSVVTTLKSGVASNWDSTLGHYITTGITNVKNSISRFTWEGAGNAIVTKLRNGISTMWSTLTTYITTSITNLKNSISNADWASAGKAIPMKLKNGISDAWWNVTSFISSGINSIKNKFYDTDWASLGRNICSGIEDGINRGWSWVTNAAKDLADSALNAAKDKLDINSPSKVFRDVIGRAIPEGLAAGIEKESDLAIRAVNNLTTSVANADIPQLEIPSVALGKIIPYETTKNIDTLNSTVKSLLDVLQSTKSNAVTREDLITILNTILPTMLQNYVSFYIGDEQIARHANAGNSLLDYRFNPVGN